MTLPYVADFTQGIPKEFGWTSDDAIWSDGVITMRRDAVLLIGDANWTNYQVTVKANNFGVCKIGVRAKNDANMMMVEHSARDLYFFWNEVKDGTLSRIADFSAPYDTGLEVRVLTVSVKDNLYQGNNGKAFSVDGHPSGKVYLKISGGARLFGLRIDPLS
jgi:hypothetical protein